MSKVLPDRGFGRRFVGELQVQDVPKDLGTGMRVAGQDPLGSKNWRTSRGRVPLRGHGLPWDTTEIPPSPIHDPDLCKQRRKRSRDALATAATARVNSARALNVRLSSTALTKEEQSLSAPGSPMRHITLDIDNEK